MLEEKLMSGAGVQIFSGLHGEFLLDIYVVVEGFYAFGLIHGRAVARFVVAFT